MKHYDLTPKVDEPLSVAQATKKIKKALESIPGLRIVGEISNFKRASSGHWYFSLKDSDAQIRCNMWRSYTNRVPFQPADGTKVVVTGSLNVYAPRGEYSLVVSDMEELGVGHLRQIFEALKRKLRIEGLFEKEYKKPLPLLPRKIGIVTSGTGAALRDILRVLKERFAGVHVLIFPAKVQGEGAAHEIATGIRWLDRFGECDLIIAGRGGGSEEDLWAFNEEIVARAIFEANTPIISAVGHEVDHTISDFVADVRAATPSNAAEIAIRSHVEYRQKILVAQKTMEQSMQRRLLILKNRINISERHPIFIRVRNQVNDYQRRLTDLENRMQRKLLAVLQDRKLRLAKTASTLSPLRLQGKLDNLQSRLKNADQDLQRRTSQRLDKARVDLSRLTFRLEDLSPLKTLNRGFAAAYNQKNKLIKTPGDVQIGEVIRVRLSQGEIRARVLGEETQAVQENLFDLT